MTEDNNDYIPICSKPVVLEIHKYDSLIRINNKLVPIGDMQWQILIALAQQPGKIVPAQELIQQVSWSPLKDYETTEKRRLYSAIKVLKEKLKSLTGHALIENYWSKGYSVAPICDKKTIRPVLPRKYEKITFSEKEIAFFFEAPYFKMLNAISSHPYMKQPVNNKAQGMYLINLRAKIKRRKFNYSELRGLFRCILVRG